MTKTINGLTVTTSAASGDFLPIWRAANSDTRKITKANFMGGVLTGAGTVATGGFTLTVGGTSTINGSVVGNMTGSGTVATGGFTLTVPATGTAVLTSGTQTVAGVKTYSDDARFGAASQYLSVKRVGATLSNAGWTSVITGLTGVSIIFFQLNNNATNYGGVLYCINNAGTLTIASIESTNMVSGVPTGYNVGYQASGTALQLYAGPSWPSSVGCNLGVIQLVW